MAKTPQERNKTSSEKKKAAGEKELRHKVRPGIQEALNRVKARADMKVTSDLLQVAIMKMDLMTDEELAEFTTYPRHEIVLSEKVAESFKGASIRQILAHPDQDEDDQIDAPKPFPHGEQQCNAAQLDILRTTHEI